MGSFLAQNPNQLIMPETPPPNTIHLYLTEFQACVLTNLLDHFVDEDDNAAAMMEAVAKYQECDGEEVSVSLQIIQERIDQLLPIEDLTKKLRNS